MTLLSSYRPKSTIIEISSMKSEMVESGDERET